MNSVYVPHKEAIFSHGVHAISGDRDKAIAFADQAAAQDQDDYHTWLVYKVPLDRLCDITYRKFDGMGFMEYSAFEPVVTVHQVANKIDNPIIVSGYQRSIFV